jgi:type I restriction enzyme R subunit
MNEQETCRTFVVPGLKAAGWDRDQIREQYGITAGKLVASARGHRTGDRLVADYVLEYRDDLPLAVVEAKRTKIDSAAGIEQAKRYAKRLELPVAYATNGREIWEIVIGGAIRQRADFPSPDELWKRFCESEGVQSELEKQMLLAPFDSSLRDNNLEPKRPRYYQRLAVNRALQAIARGDRQILLTLATGTGKTMVAFQLVAKLRKSGWTPGRMPRVLYLADRSLLIDQPKDDYFAPAFKDVVHKISKGHAQRSREVYFALYQSLDQGDEQELFTEYARDYFDLIIVDECHRGSARASSQWRRILEHFNQAVQIGLTATPIRQDEVDTFEYFGNPVYEYSLRDGIEDGFLAPYRVRRVRLNIDMTGFRPTPGQRDVAGDVIPDRLYTPRQYEKVLAVLERTEEAARHLTQYLHDTDRMGKTIVFCENNDHAHRMRVALHNANLDIVKQFDNYVFRVTDADGAHGLAQLEEFRKIDSDAPVIAVTSQLLTTGIDLPSVKNIVIFRRIGSMPLFKQIIGRGTRLCADVYKGSFDIIDFVEATTLFNDRNFDGPPLKITEVETDEQGNLVDTTEEEPDQEEVAEPHADYEEQDQGSLAGEDGKSDALSVEDDRTDLIMTRGKRIYVDGVEVYVWNEVHYQLESDGQTLRLVEYREFVRDRVRSMRLSPTDLRTQWAVAKGRAALRKELETWDIEPDDLMVKLGHPEADPLDLLINAAWELPLVSRAERALRVRREHREFLESFGPQARAVLDTLLDKFSEHGAEELSARALRVPPFTEMGNIRELGELFGGRDGLHVAIDDLGKRLFDVG